MVALSLGVSGPFLQQVAPPSNSLEGPSLMGWIVGFGLAGLAMALIARPLLIPGEQKNQGPGNKKLENRQAFLAELYEKARREKKSQAELEFDLELGNLEEVDYTKFKEKSQENLIFIEKQIKHQEEQLKETEQPNQSLKTKTPLLKKSRGPLSPQELNSPNFSPPSPSRPQRNLPSEAESRQSRAVKEAMKCIE